MDAKINKDIKNRYDKRQKVYEFSKLPNTINNNSTMPTIRSNMRRTNKIKQNKHPKHNIFIKTSI